MHTDISIEDQPRQPTLTIRFRSPVAELSSYFKRVMAWLREHGHAPSGAPMYEFYLNDPLHAPESELETKLVVPLASSSG